MATADNSPLILITRPSGRGEALAERIDAAGLNAVQLPLIAVEPILDEPAQTRLNGLILESPVPIFTSTYAVAHCVAALSRRAQMNLFPNPAVAIGAATAVAMSSAGFRNILQPEQASSEGIIAMDLPNRFAQQRLLLIKGVGGRGLLEVNYQRIIDVVDVYRRVPDLRNASSLAKLYSSHAKHRPVIGVVTSDAILTLLAQSLKTVNLPFEPFPLVVASSRIEAEAHRRGFQNVSNAEGADDEALFHAIVKLTELKQT